MQAELSVARLFAVLERLVKDPAHAAYCVAFSGGLDSTALLCGMREIQREHSSLRLRALHVNHHLLPEADAWAEQCRAVAAQLDVPFEVLDATVETGAGISTEAAARDARYALFRSRLQKDELLLTAHHQDDQLETVLLQLMRGAGVAGLAAMPNAAIFGEGLHLRPLLGFNRDAFAEFVRPTGLSWIEDTSNADLRFDRNYVRHRLLPAIRERWPSAAASASRSAAHLASAQYLLDELAKIDMAAANEEGALKVEALRVLEPRRARNLLRYWIRSAGFRSPSTVKLNDILRQMLDSREDASPCIAWDTAQVRRRRGKVHLEPR